MARNRSMPLEALLYVTLGVIVTSGAFRATAAFAVGAQLAAGRCPRSLPDSVREGCAPSCVSGIWRSVNPMADRLSVVIPASELQAMRRRISDLEATVRTERTRPELLEQNRQACVQCGELGWRPPTG